MTRDNRGPYVHTGMFVTPIEDVKMSIKEKKAENAFDPDATQPIPVMSFLFDKSEVLGRQFRPLEVSDSEIEGAIDSLPS